MDVTFSVSVHAYAHMASAEKCVHELNLYCIMQCSGEYELHDFEVDINCYRVLYFLI